MQVQRFVRPYHEQRRWLELATVRFETLPGEQAQVDYGQLWVWIGAQPEKIHLFVFTLGYSRRLYTRAYRHERLTSLLDGHEHAFRWFGGVTLSCLYDNPRNLVLGRREHNVLWHPLFEDFARYLRLHPARLPALSGAHQRQGRERRQVCKAQRAGGPALQFVG
jgi:transposase